MAPSEGGVIFPSPLQADASGKHVWGAALPTWLGLQVLEGRRYSLHEHLLLQVCESMCTGARVSERGVCVREAQGTIEEASQGKS